MKNPIIIGTRGSELALWQANHVKDRMEALGLTCELKIIKTQGDAIQHLSLDKLEGKGFFTKEIEDALLRNEIDIAVHSHKDLETEQPSGLVIAAVSERAQPNDVLLIHPGAVDQNMRFGLKESAVVGSSSARRKAQMLHHRPDIELKDIRGNVPTRVNKLREGQYDAILMAKAGLDRLQLDLTDLYVEVLDPEVFVPAPAQGVLAIQCRESDAEVREALKALNSPDTAELIGIERSVLNKMNGGCHLPLGVYATKEDDEFTVQVALAETWDAPVRMITFIGEFASTLPDIIIRELKGEA